MEDLEAALAVTMGKDEKGKTMSEGTEFEGVIGLADFLSDLRAELTGASCRAGDHPLRLGLEQVTVSLDIGITVGGKVGGTATAKAKFWVFASAEAKLQAEASRSRMTTQHLTLTLKPRVEANGWTRRADVEGEVVAGEQLPKLLGSTGSIAADDSP